MSNLTPNKAKISVTPNKQQDKSQEKNLTTTENYSDVSAKKPVKRLRAWCGECYQFFEFGPFAKVCQQHVLKKNCNVFECKKKLINPSLSKKCIRKFANINSENRHTYCVDEAEMRSWDPLLKIQNCLLAGETSQIHFSSSEKNRKNSFDSIKFSDLNLDLPENSELLFDTFSGSTNNYSSNVNAKNSNAISFLKNKMGEKNKVDFNCRSILNKKKNNDLKDNYRKRNIQKFGDADELNSCESEVKIKEAFAFRSPLSICESGKVSLNKDAEKMKVSSETRIKSQFDQDCDMNSPENQTDEKVIDNKEKSENTDNFGVSLTSNNINCSVKSNINNCKNRLKNFLRNSKVNINDNKKGCKNRKILRKRGKGMGNLIEKSVKATQKPDCAHRINQASKQNTNSFKHPKLHNNSNREASKEKEKSVREKKEESKEGLTNVSGLIDQIGNLKFENSKNDSILEDEILIKQFDNIYFNYNKRKSECEIISLNDSNLEILSAKNVNVGIEEDFDFLNNSNFNFNLSSNRINNDVNYKTANFSIFKSEVNSAIKKFGEANKTNAFELAKDCDTKKTNDDLLNKNANCDLNLNLNLIGLSDNYYSKNNLNSQYESNVKETSTLKSNWGAAVDEANLSPLCRATQKDKSNLKTDFICKEKFGEIQVIGEIVNTDLNQIINSTGNNKGKSYLFDDHEIFKKPKINLHEDQIDKDLSENNESIRNDRSTSKGFNSIFAVENQNFKISSCSNNQIIITPSNKNESQIKENLILKINKGIELNFLSLDPKNKNFSDTNLKQEIIGSFGFEPVNSESKNKIHKISDDAHIDEIMLLVRDHTGIPAKVLSKLKDAMKKKGIFNARMLRLFKKKKQSWNFIKKDFAKNCTEIEAICIYLGELLEE